MWNGSADWVSDLRPQFEICVMEYLVQRSEQNSKRCDTVTVKLAVEHRVYSAAVHTHSRSNVHLTQKKFTENIHQLCDTSVFNHDRYSTR